MTHEETMKLLDEVSQGAAKLYLRNRELEREVAYLKRRLGEEADDTIEVDAFNPEAEARFQKFIAPLKGE